MSSEKVKYLPETGHWKELFKNKNAHIGAHNINKGEELTLTISSVEKGGAVDSHSGADIEVPMLKFEEAPPLILNITNGNVIESMYGAMRADWIGKRITIYKQMGKSFGGQAELVKVKPLIPPPLEDPTEWIKSIESCSTMDELKKRYMEVPKHLQSVVAPIKDAVKARIEAAK